MASRIFSISKQFENSDGLYNKPENDLPIAIAMPLSHETNSDSLGDKEPLPPRIQRFKERRQRHQMMAAMTGGVVGCIVFLPFPPAGALVGGFVAHRTVKTVGRRKQARMERTAAQQVAAGAPSEYYL